MARATLPVEGLRFDEDEEMIFLTIDNPFQSTGRD